MRSLLDADAIIISFCSVICISVYWYNMWIIKQVYEQIFVYLKYLRDDKFCEKIAYVTVGFIMCFFASSYSLFLMLYFVYYQGEKSIFILFLNFSITFYFLLTVNSVIQQFSYVLIYFFKIFESINLELEKLVEWTEVWFVEKRDFKFLFVRGGNIWDLVTVYIKICGLCDEINDAFGASVAAAVFLAFLQLLESVYQFTNNGSFLMFVIWFGNFVLKAWFILYPCEIIKNEVSKN